MIKIEEKVIIPQTLTFNQNLNAAHVQLVLVVSTPKTKFNISLLLCLHNTEKNIIYEANFNYLFKFFARICFFTGSMNLCIENTDLNL